MYHFKITEEEGGYRLELGGIKLLIDGYSIINNRHLLKTPNKAVAFFNIGKDIYGISNEPLNYDTAEALYDSISQQYKVLKNPGPITLGS